MNAKRFQFALVVVGYVYFWLKYPTLFLPMAVSFFATMIALAYAMWLAKYWKRADNSATHDA